MLLGLALQALPVSPANADAQEQFKAGRQAAAQGDFERAVSEFSQVIASGEFRGKNLAIALNNRGIALARTGLYDDAIRDYDTAIQLVEDYRSAINNRGLAFFHRGEFERAIQDYNHVVTLAPDKALGWNNRGLAYAFLGQYERAVPDFSAALERDGKLIPALHSRGRSQYHLAAYADAAADFAAAQQLQPNNPLHALWRHLALTASGTDGLGELRARAKTFALDTLIGKVVGMFLGDVEPDAVLSGTDRGDIRLYRFQRCVAYFYVGKHLAMQGRKRIAIQMLRAAVATRAVSVAEHADARAELRRLGP